jgi:serine/threonine-protein kinase
MTQVREILAGRYELLDVLGRGGMGVVYRASDRVLGRTVAIKVLPAERAEDPMFVARFEREARSAAGLNHPGIVAVYDSGRDADTRYIVMECVPGLSLAQLLRQRRPLAAAEAVEIATQVASALAAAHRAGIIHRDVKPGNVMVDNELRVKVLDFGIARAIAATSLTNTAIVLGSAPYMAPEVTRGESADERSDIYSLGCVLYEMLTGGPPFSGDLGAAVMHQHNTASPRPLRELNSTTPAALDALVMQMLAKQPGERPQTAAQLVDALPATLENRTAPTAVRPVAAGAPAGGGLAATLVRPGAAAAALTEATRVLRRTASGRRERYALAAAIAILLIAIAVGASGSSSPRRAAAAKTPRTSTAARSASTRSAPTTTAAKATTAAKTTTAASVPTVTSAADALTALSTADAQSGAIDSQAAQQILGGLQDSVKSYNDGNATDALHKVDDLTTHLAQLSANGDVQASALPGLTTAISNLRSAITTGAPANSQPGATAQPATPPATPPGKHGKDGKHGGGGGGGD